MRQSSAKTLNLQERVELLGDEELIAESAVEGLAVAVLPGRAGVDERSGNPSQAAPADHRVRGQSVPLSMRMLPGHRPVAAMTSSRTAMVASAVNERAALVTNASRVNSSTILKNRKPGPSLVRSYWKSSAHT